MTFIGPARKSVMVKQGGFSAGFCASYPVRKGDIEALKANKSRISWPQTAS
jgi:hypothetical protein